MGDSMRYRARRNALVSAINAGLENELFTLEDSEQKVDQVYQHLIGGISAVTYVHSIGFGELSFHVAIQPTPECMKLIRGAFAGFHAGEGWVTGWLERKEGKWIQTSTSGKNTTRIRKTLVSRLAAVSVEPNGYSDRGRFFT